MKYAKKFFVIAVLMITAISAFALSKDSSYREARKSGALAKIKIHIVDDLGHNVSNADVSVFFGMNFRPSGRVKVVVPKFVLKETAVVGIMSKMFQRVPSPIHIELSQIAHTQSGWFV